jgi:bifunctional polynucleotide phosphatase/kinase
MKWEYRDSVIYSQTRSAGDTIVAIAGFNLYGTLITPDWQWRYPNIREKLKNLCDDGYRIVLFINRPNLVKNNKHHDFMAKLDELERRLSIPLDIYISTDDDRYTKPMTGMWELCGMPDGFFCGDCAGRIYGRRDSDFGKCDILFSINTGLKFYTPEQLFNHPERPYRPYTFYMLPYIQQKPFPWDVLKKETRNRPHAIIMVGYTAPWWTDVLRDITITLGKNNYYITNTQVETEEAIKEKRNIIIHGRNPRRRHLYSMLKQKYSRILLYFDFPKELCMHLNHYRVQKYSAKKESVWALEKYYEQQVVPFEDEGCVITLKPEHILKDLGKEYGYVYDI